MRRPGPWPIAITLIGLAVLLGLGIWQLQRKTWKEALLADIRAGRNAAPVELAAAMPADLAALNHRPVRLHGRFLHDLEAHIGPRPHRGRDGVHVLTPLRLSGGATVLVNRGWVPRTHRDPAARAEGQIAGDVVVHGILRSRLERGIWTPDHDGGQDLWFWYDVSGIARARGLKLAPAVVLADDRANPGGLPIGGLAKPALRNNHLQYAITWFTLAGALILVFLLAHRRRGEGT